MCSANQFCNIEGSKHLDKGVQVTKDSMNSMIPECGCCTSEPPKIYQIKNKTVAFDVPLIKRHLMKYGSAVGGFMVYKNFIKDINHGKFLETKGIYIHNVNYSGKEEDIEDCAGGHAIAIVGWGVEKDLKVGDHIYPKVEYWICRNSWSEKWGNDGYFKYALFQEYSDANANSDLPLKILDDAKKIDSNLGDFMSSLYYKGNSTWEEPKFRKWLDLYYKQKDVWKFGDVDPNDIAELVNLIPNSQSAKDYEEDRYKGWDNLTFSNIFSN